VHPTVQKSNLLLEDLRRLAALFPEPQKVLIS
jgi:hypothetical protein